MRTLFGFLLCLHLGFWVAAQDADTAPKRPVTPAKLAPSVDDAKVARVAVAILERTHYLQHPFNEEFSSKLLDRYLDALDPAHMIFLETDVAEFGRWRTKLNELILRFGDTSPADFIFTRFLERFDQQVQFMTNMLATNKFVFDTDEHYHYSRKDMPRPKDMSAAKTLWFDRLRNEYLQEKLNKQKPEEIVKTITHRYARQWRNLKDFDNDEVFQLFLTSLAHVYDPHSDFMGKPTYENFNISMKLSLFGIGAILTSEDGYCKISELKPGPAMRSKQLKPNDKIIAVAQGTNAFVDVVDWKLNKVVELIRGDKGSEVRLNVIPADAPDPSTRKIVSLMRDEIKLEDQEAKAKLIEIPSAKGTPERLGIIDLPSFYADLSNRSAEHKSTTTDIARLLKRLKAENVSGIVLDLRRNGGGSLEEAINLTGLFIKEGPVVQVKDPDGTITVDRDTNPSVVYDGPLIVLTSRFSASASEILAAALQDYGRALIVGDVSTHGKGTVQSVMELNRFLRTTNNVGALKLTIRKFYRANGESTQLKGVTPDVVLPSVNNYAEVGEASLINPLAWDTVAPAKFEPVNVVNTFRDELRKRSSDRVGKDVDFDYLRDEINRFRKAQEEKSVSLNEQQRLTEKKENEARADARKKELKKRGEPNYKAYDINLKNVDLPGLTLAVAKTNAVDVVGSKTVKPAQMDKSDDALDEEAPDESVPALDITMEETKRILEDLIALIAKKAAVAIQN